MRTINSRKAWEKKLIEEIQKELDKAFRQFIGQKLDEEKEESFEDPALPKEKK